MVHLHAAGVDDALAGVEKLPAEQIADPDGRTERLWVARVLVPEQQAQHDVVMPPDVPGALFALQPIVRRERAQIAVFGLKRTSCETNLARYCFKAGSCVSRSISTAPVRYLPANSPDQGSSSRGGCLSRSANISKIAGFVSGSFSSHFAVTAVTYSCDDAVQLVTDVGSAVQCRLGQSRCPPRRQGSRSWPRRGPSR